MQVTKMGKKVQDRCNLTVLLEPGYEDLADVRACACMRARLPCIAFVCAHV